MSVLIKGMEMPDRCFACPLCDVIDSEVNCVISHGSYKEYREIAEQTAINGRPSDCPLVPVPPHGRLIDADALDIYRREEQAQEDIDKSPFSEYLEGLKDGLHEAAKCLSIAPTIIGADYPPSVPLEQVWTELFGEDGE